MNKVWLIGGAICALVLVLVFVARSPRDATQAVTATSPNRPQSPALPAGTGTTAPESASSATRESTQVQPPSEETSEIFRTDTNGKLVLDEQTRLKLEAFFARTEPKDVGVAALELVQQLPAPAAAQALDVVDRYRNYQAAQDANYRDEGPSTAEDAIVELESLHTLRVEHFGPEVAKAFYGDEERISRELIELMRLEKDQSLTMEEKADRAQRLRDTLPAVSAADKGQRPPPSN
jgi:hypothetical protein